MLLEMEQRYSKQTRFAPIGERGQRRLGESSALLVGAGALGTHLATTLVRAGIGTLWLIDRDVVEIDNLQRQVLFDERDARQARPKAVAAATHLGEINSACALHAVVEDFEPSTYDALGIRPTLIIDGTDNYATRYTLNDLAMRDNVPWIYGGAVAAQGSAMVVLPGRTPCLRCLMPEPPPTGEVETCDTSGILAPAIAAVTAFMGAQALKILSGNEDAVARGVFTADLWNDRYGLRLQNATVAADCPSCSGSYPALVRQPRPPLKLCGRNAVQVHPRAGAQVDLDRLAQQLGDAVDSLERTAYMLRFCADGCRFHVFPGGRALMLGIDDTDRARILYDRFVGG